MKDYNGFMKIICYDFENKTEYFKCFGSDTDYTIETLVVEREVQLGVTDICLNDVIFYQACGVADKINFNAHSSAPCGHLCHTDVFYNLVEDLQTNICRKGRSIIGGEMSCNNIDVDQLKSQCKNENQMCDGIITQYIEEQIVFADHELYCNGFVYGIVCNVGYYNIHDAAYISCNSRYSCKDGREEELCLSANATEYTCESSFSKEIVPLFNFSRCGPIGRVDRWSQYQLVVYKSLCVDYKDQTNCSDQSRVGLSCEINGHISTVANQIICNPHLGYRPPLCDDNLDVACLQLSFSCLIHKHRFCDGSRDCPDGLDESSCSGITHKTCLRKYGSPKHVGVPFSWIGDGMEDCLDGEDEHGDWPTCGFGETQRYSAMNSHSYCPEVFLCYPGFIEFSDLCDGTDSCGNENEVCTKSRNKYTLFDSPEHDRGKVKILHCLNGLSTLDEFINGKCSNANFSFTDIQVLGKTSFIKLFLPQSPNWKVDCDHIYGAAYVYLSCLNLCRSSPCILNELVHFDSCQFQYNDRIFSITNNDQLTFLVRNRIDGSYHNDIFPCKNGGCVEYSKVCNLVDDCGDGTDEQNCTNHFRCDVNNDLIPLPKVCDNTIDCSDLSDECNDRCVTRNKIIDSFTVTVSGWILGVLAVCLNLVTIPVSIKLMINSKKYESLANHTLLVLINLGDLLVGIFIFTISVYNVYYGSSYCKMQLEWLTSKTCLFVGVLNTVGIMISVLSMVALSLFRVINLSRSLAIPSPVSRKGILKIFFVSYSIIVGAIVTSLMPMVEKFEDYFVNGLYHGSDNPLFLGAPSKKSHMDILQAYYGRLSSQFLSWGLTRQLLAKMFSQDYSEFQNRKIQFYGNDAVCIFKYLVRKEDPQFVFVWVSHAIQIICFIVISVSYIIIARVSSLNSVAVVDKATAKFIERRAHKVQRVAATIILTDFISWIPFIVVCIMHSFEFLDATKWYSIFSLVLNPLNSVINPILLNPMIKETVINMLRQLSCNPFRLVRLRHLAAQPDGVVVSMHVVQEGVQSGVGGDLCAQSDDVVVSMHVVQEGVQSGVGGA